MNTQSVRHMTVPRAGWLDLAVTIVGRLTLAAMIGWLVVKDWLLSTVAVYPYTSSITISAGIICAVVAAIYCRRTSHWRDCVVLLAAIAVVGYLLIGDSSFFTIRLMPGAGILLCAFAFPLPENPKWSVRLGSGHSFASGLRRKVYIAAALLGIASFSFGPAFTNFSPSYLVFPAAIIIFATFIRLSVSYCCRVRFGGFLPFILSLSVGALYVFSQLHGLATGYDENLLGIGLDNTARSGLDGAPVLLTDGLVSVSLKCLIVVMALTVNFDRMLAVAQSLKGNFIPDRETKQALALSSAGLTALSAYSLLCLSYKDVFLAASPIGVCVVVFAAASLAIVSRTNDASSADKGAQTWHPRPLIIFLAIFLLCVGSFTGFVVHSCLERAASADRKGLSIEALPDSIRSAMSSEDFAKPCTLQDVHAAVRSAFGFKMPVGRTIGLDLGMQVIEPMVGPPAFKTILGSIFGCTENMWLSKQTVDAAYLNGMNFGTSPNTLAAATQYYFHKPVGELTDSDARFLVSYRSANSEPFADATNRTNAQFLSSPSTWYSFQLFKTWMPGSYRNPEVWLPGWVNHFGALNSLGDAVGTEITNDGPVAFICRSGRVIQLPGLSGIASGFAFAINDKDEIAGSSQGDACMWDSHGKVYDLGVLPGFASCIATGVNNRGQVVGYAYNGTLSADKNNRYSMTQQAHAFLWQDGQMRDLGVPPGCVSSRAFGINDAGQVVGWVLTDNLQTKAMVWQNGVMQEIGTLGGDTSAATAINEAGVVVGSSQRVDGTVSAFLWQNGVMHDLGRLPGDITSRAASINNKGQVVGKSYTGTDGWASNGAGGRAFIWDSGHGIRAIVPAIGPVSQSQTTTFLIYNDAPVPNYPSATAYSINDSGQIVGLYYEPSKFGEMRHMFLLTAIK